MVEPGSDKSSRIEELRNDHQDMVDYLQSNGQILLQSRAQDAFSKTLVVAAASYFEIQLTQIIVELYRESTAGVEALAQFVERKAIGRGFAQLFQWDRRNANYFYSFFGEEFASRMEQKVRDSDGLADSVRAFLEIGNLRNQMVHGDYADFQLGKTVDEVYDLYQKAAKFVDEFQMTIREFLYTGEVP